ncbi:Peptide deformylase 1A, chloroplastic [Dichanthelium oligosanthes]|uniref:Peptide deformylase n=1 Tax=Dichanthelium oligosanthes TaxID=888268 RepID=A0A1E5WN41_9POAL|nr:Peptide deformylase 1A, chloroplastic [Dichanthelium oligosanthes]
MKMVALLRPLSAAAAAALLLAPAAPLTSSAVAASAVSGRRWRSVRTNAGGGWLSGLLGDKGGGAPTAMTVTPGTVKAGDPVLHEPAQEVAPGDVSSEKVQGVIDRMIDVMRKAPGVGLAAPQIGVPLRVIINPKLKNTSKRTARFFEGCLSVDGYRAVVERHLDVEVSGLDRNGNPIKVQASGWQARILQHECDHLEGTLYVDKMVPRTFRIVDNLDLPLPIGCPPLGAR